MENIQEASIQCSKKTRDRLKSHKKYRRQTYDELLNNWMDELEEVKE